MQCPEFLGERQAKAQEIDTVCICKAQTFQDVLMLADKYQNSVPVVAKYNKLNDQ